MAEHVEKGTQQAKEITAKSWNFMKGVYANVASQVETVARDNGYKVDLGTAHCHCVGHCEDSNCSHCLHLYEGHCDMLVTAHDRCNPQVDLGQRLSHCVDGCCSCSYCCCHCYYHHHYLRLRVYLYIIIIFVIVFICIIIKIAIL